MQKVAVVIGASKGIGFSIAHKLSSKYLVAVCSRTFTDLNLITSLINNQGGKCIPYQCDVKSPVEIESMFENIKSRFNRIDIVVYNAGAIFWGSVEVTNQKRFELLQNVNVNGLYKTIQMVLPVFRKQMEGRFIVVSPPIYSRFFRGCYYLIFKGKTAYAVGKVGMSVLVQGLAVELVAISPSISITSLWPATAIKSAVTDFKKVPNQFLRIPDIFSDAVLSIISADTILVNGKCLIDEDWLRDHDGVTDFVKYNVEGCGVVQRMLPIKFPRLEVEEQEDIGIVMSKL